MPNNLGRVVVVGGGFAGLSATTKLTDAGFHVTLVDRHPYTTFQPLLYQVATGGLNPGDITYALRRFVSNKKHHLGHFRRGTVTGIDTQNKTVQVSRGDDLPYDYLVLSQGVGAGYFGIEGAAEHTRSIYTRAAAIEVRDIIFSGLEHLASAKDPDRRFTVAIVGGGPTGVEMAGALAEMKSEGLPVLYPELHIDAFRVVMVEMGDTLLAPFDAKLRDYTIDELRLRGVDVRLSTAIERVEPDKVTFKGGGTMDVDLVIWAAGVGAHPIVADWGMPQGRGGRILVDEDLRVQGFTDVFAIGDAALIEKNPLPQLAQPALQQGEHVAKQIAHVRNGEPTEPFAYFDQGTMATIARNAAVVQLAPMGPLPELKITGFIGWLTWVVVHLRSLLGGRNRLQAMINMGFRYLTWPKSATGIQGDVTDSPAMLARSGGRTAIQADEADAD
ncbi:NAD(P)/FAD-dependent oxidoreductase [Tessaracoccus sp. SD287]|uniref:NAD(P)/FAD-dependent oxidoreductase n=1 Tax=Tessaracoccus sp. SD287 TaxID=2782008 RepID=UPI001A95D043|nr:NAD(P)/FAD-dependent oxidoreductase [Tessaracoccus sp. SD287]MBO1030781.1 NAD(P)/FAD-dependent oxidoreductase [Tessaracoccus sp. SD287]